LVDHYLFVAVEADRHGAARLGADAGLDVLGGLLALGRQLVDRLLELSLQALDLGLDLALELLGLALVLLAQLTRLGLDVRAQADGPLVLVHVQDGEHVLARFLVHVGDDVVGEVEDLLEVPRGHVEQQPHAAGDALKYQTWLTGDASLMWPMRSRRTLDRVTSTPHLSQMMPL